MEAFQNRVQKMYRHYAKWARRKGLTAYRIYDNDITEYPVSIDVYDECLYVCVFQNHKINEEDYDAWLGGCLTAIISATEFPLSNIHVKERKRQRGTKQYEKLEDSQEKFVVTENGLKFWVNLADYLDTGLFLDHRNTRLMVQKEAKGKRFLNLFAYTGAFTVYAAAGEASLSTTVDMSKTYLAWAQANLELNELQGLKHELIQADVLKYLETVRPNSYDIIVLDPPTFSNSKRMDDILDVQRDHVAMINACLKICSPGGTIYFSTNFRKFKLDEEAIVGAASIKNISSQTVPSDFRDTKIHLCYKIIKI